MKGNSRIHTTPKPSYVITHLSDWLSHSYIYNPLCATEDVRQNVYSSEATLEEYVLHVLMG